MAAGLGFKTFTTGEVLTAADTNGYLMQGINVFSSTAARDAAITSPQEGQFAFTKDTNGLWYYDGAAWVASGATGDIEGVTAGVGITGGGTSGTVTITNDMATTITAAGDIVVGTGSGTYDNLPIGTTAQVLTADTTVSPYKVKWSTPAASASGLTLIKRASFSGVATTTTSFDSSFNSSYKVFVVVCEKIQGTNGATLYLQTRAAASTQNSAYYGAAYGYDNINTLRTAVSSNAAQFSLFQIENGRDSNFTLNFCGVGNTNESPSWSGVGFSMWQAVGFAMGCKRDSAGSTVDGFILSASTGNITGTVAIYGLATA